MENKRLIEVDFPLKEVSEESAREKSIRHGHISTLHPWWARKPLAASRASVFATLIHAPNSADDLKKKLQFVVELSKWRNSINNRVVQEARRAIKYAFEKKIPKVLDCFAGGGSIPFEASKLGCDTYALELNPVAVLILKASLEYPQKFNRTKAEPKRGFMDFDFSASPLVRDIKRWGNWVLEQVRNEIGKFYPEESYGKIVVAYIWAKTIQCRNSSCKTWIPLMTQLWLSKKAKKNVAIKICIDKGNNQVNLKIVEDKDINFDPSQGTVRLGKAVCPICGGVIDSRTVRKEAREGRMGERQIVVISHKKGFVGKTYRIAKEEDFRIFKQAEAYLRKKVESWRWDFDPIPNEFLHTPSMLGTKGELNTFFVHLQPVTYGMLRWGDLFNSRQKLMMITFIEKIRLAYERMIYEGYENEYAKAVITYLALGADRIAGYGSKLSILNPTGGRGTAHSIGRLALLPIAWAYAEANPFNPAGAGWQTAMEKNIKWIQHASQISASPTQISQGTATRLPYIERYFDVVITDPPYYDNVPYSDLSDFFYVWLKRVIGDIHPDLFSTPLTPKTQEIIQNTSLIRRGSSLEVSEYKKLGLKDRDSFENKLSKAFGEIYRVLRDDGIAVIVFTHSSTEAWETIINSLLKSKLIITASWPIHTEKEGRLSSQGKAALASSIYMVCRKRTWEQGTYFNKIKSAIEKRIKEKLEQFWKQGISGADFFVSAIGPAVEVFGRYSKVEKLSGEEVSVQELLEYVRKIVSEYALERVLKKADLGGVDNETRFYLLWRWVFGNAKAHFDDAIKLSRPLGIELTSLWDRGGFVKKEKEFVRVPDPKERAKDTAFMRKEKLTSMIDVLHRVVILWERGEREKIKEILNETGYSGNEIFWQTAQAISEVLPQGDKEKQLIQGFLYGKEVYIKEIVKGQQALFKFMEDD